MNLISLSAARQTSWKLFVCLTLFLLAFSGYGQVLAASTAADCFVDVDASGVNDGTSWADAYTSLESAIADTSCGEIWVAEGLYRASSYDGFMITRDGMAIYGGFIGSETTRDARDLTANLTVLTGDITDNDDHDVNGVVTQTIDIQSPNATHVVWYYADGSGISITSATVLDGFTITAGYAEGDVGGGLYCNSVLDGGLCNPTLSNLIFIGNWAADGGGMYNDADSVESSPTLTNVIFSNNDAAGYGGGMYNDGDDGGLSNPILTNVTFDNNSAGNSGGAMYNYAEGCESSPILTDVTFTDNYARYYGGAMYNDAAYSGVSSPDLNNVTFTGNATGNDGAGGAMFNDGILGGASSPSLTNVTFTSNETGASGYGGAMYNNGYRGVSSPVLRNVTFNANSVQAGGYGGAMYNDGSYGGVSNPIISNSTFSNNTADYGGGAMFNSGLYGESSPILTDVTFSKNTVLGGQGGAVYNDGSWSTSSTYTSSISSPSFTNVTFFRNNSLYDGGALYSEGMGTGGHSNPTLTNVTFNENVVTSGYGGAIANNGTSSGQSNPTLINVTISGNRSGAFDDGYGSCLNGYEGAGISNNSANPTIINTILWGDEIMDCSAGTDGEFIPNEIGNFGTAVPVISYTIIQGSGGSSSWDTSLGTDGGYNLDIDPLLGSLSDNGGFTRTMALGSGSPAIDAGDNAACPAGDQRGNWRPLDGNHDGFKVCDIGAYEVGEMLFIPLIVK
jgi:predicted outer membrane repeat protein